MSRLYKYNPKHEAVPSELSRKMPTTFAYWDKIGSKYCLMVWKANKDTRYSAGTGQYQIASVHDTQSEAEQALSAYIDNITARNKQSNGPP